MNSLKTFGALPLSTINPSKIGAQATDVFDTAFRPFQWMHDPTQENMQQPENDASMLTLLNTLDSAPATWSNPTLWWRVENRLDLVTSLSVAMDATDTYIKVAQPLLLKPGYIVYLPTTGEQILVLDVDVDLSEGWVNNASAACNVKVDRTTQAGPHLAAALGTEVRAGVPQMGEFGEPKEGIVTIPGDPMYNFIQLFGVRVSMSKMQRNSLMAGDYGTHEQLVRENEHYLSAMLQNTILFSRRESRDTDEGMVYRTNGIINMLQDNVLSVGGTGNALTYGNVSEFIDGTFESANSGATKHVACGERLFMNILNTARQEGMVVENPRYNPALGVTEFMMTTAGGRTVTIAKHRFAFQGALTDWGTVLDLTNLARGEYAGFEWKWYMDLEAPIQGLTKSTDALLGSIAVTIKDPDTCGVIKGGVDPLVANRTGLGVVTQY
jgi:hypothetical protein